MSELKEWTADEIEEYDDARLELAEDGKIDCTRVYIKSEADKVIAELKEERRWRKCSEEMPKWGEEVLMLNNEGMFRVARFSHDFKWISWGKMHTCESDCIIYWMPLPSAPKEFK